MAPGRAPALSTSISRYVAPEPHASARHVAARSRRSVVRLLERGCDLLVPGLGLPFDQDDVLDHTVKLIARSSGLALAGRRGRGYGGVVGSLAIMLRRATTRVEAKGSL